MEVETADGEESEEDRTGGDDDDSDNIRGK